MWCDVRNRPDSCGSGSETQSRRVGEASDWIRFFLGTWIQTSESKSSALIWMSCRLHTPKLNPFFCHQYGLSESASQYVHRPRIDEKSSKKKKTEQQQFLGWRKKTPEISWSPWWCWMLPRLPAGAALDVAQPAATGPPSEVEIYRGLLPVSNPKRSSRTTCWKIEAQRDTNFTLKKTIYEKNYGRTEGKFTIWEEIKNTKWL